MAVQNKFLENNTVGILTAAVSAGQPKKGVERGPQHMLDAGLLKQLEGLNWKVEFDGKINDFSHLAVASDPDVGVAKNPRFVGKVAQECKDQVAGQLKKGNFALTIGGDHSIGLGTVCGTREVFPNACVIWVDAHADINGVDDTETGNLHGCPLSWAINHSRIIPGFEWIEESEVQPRLAHDSLVYIGLRDVDDAEKRILKQYGIKAFSMHEVDKYGIGKVVEMALDHVNPNRDRPIHLSYDALDPSIAPATGTPVRGGLSFREGHYISEAIHETGLLVAMDIVEVNPSLGEGLALEQTVKVGCSLVRAAMGETLL
ncbi:arginase [Conidiobolus coronatus NRRL 28638]|uniref:Arginase n=1 Tax=Conidiobolus coronatus (strain ATCC 28846 / CBS 209.66 / NRRL 28638) TaxID=796925 RepID=A0A137PBI8_CONC2|nr:arginase [Conidiobolus coronatus NRRL 28638]|eukprot:KXN72367.1 arginase [Conidiobolus coronatus NRRL 28638]